MKEAPQCLTLLRATQVAQEKGLIGQNNRINCQFDAECTGTECLLSQEEMTYFFAVEQHPQYEVSSGIERFMQRLTATAQILNLETVINH